MIEKYPPELVGELLREKSLDLMTAVIKYITSALIYFQHGFFCGSFSILPNLLDNLGYNLAIGAEKYTEAEKKLVNAISAYDQALVTKILEVVFSLSGTYPCPDRLD